MEEMWDMKCRKLRDPSRKGDINTCACMNVCARLSAHIGLWREPKERKERGMERCKCREHFQIFLLKRTATANVSCTNTAAGKKKKTLNFSGLIEWFGCASLSKSFCFVCT